MIKEAPSDKHIKRRSALRIRDDLDVCQRERLNQQIAAYREKIFAFIKNSVKVNPPLIVAGYWPIKSEVDIRPLLSYIADQHVQLVLPALTTEQTLVFRSFDIKQCGNLVPMRFATLAPPAESPVQIPSAIILPVVAFDEEGNRLGYGGGFYDRTLAAFIDKGVNPVKIGVAYSCQKVAPIMAELTDIRLDALLTEHGLISF